LSVQEIDFAVQGTHGDSHRSAYPGKGLFAHEPVENLDVLVRLLLLLAGLAQGEGLGAEQALIPL
jgi:hypothetical protein